MNKVSKISLLFVWIFFPSFGAEGSSDREETKLTVSSTSLGKLSKPKRLRGSDGRFLKVSTSEDWQKKKSHRTEGGPVATEVDITRVERDLKNKKRGASIEKKALYVSNEDYFRFCQSGPELKPDEYVICMHGGKESYIDSWLSGKEKGYPLQRIGIKNSQIFAREANLQDIAVESDNQPQFLKGIQVVPLYRYADGSSILQDATIHFERAIRYAWRDVCSSTIMRGGQVTQEQAEMKAVSANKSFSTVLFVVVQAGYLQKGDVNIEAGIPDEKRPEIKGTYKLNLVTPFESLPSYENLVERLGFKAI